MEKVVPIFAPKITGMLSSRKKTLAFTKATSKTVVALL